MSRIRTLLSAPDSDHEAASGTSRTAAASLRPSYRLILIAAFAVIALTLAVNIIMSALASIKQSDAVIGNAAAEVQGIRYVTRTERLLQKLLAYEGALTAERIADIARARRNAPPHALAAAAADVTRAIDGIADRAAPTALDTSVAPLITRVRAAWNDRPRGAVPDEPRVVRTIDAVQTLLYDTTNDSGLTNDPSIDAVNFEDAIVRYAQALAETLQAGMLADVNIVADNRSLEDRFTAAQLLAQAKSEITIGDEDIGDEILVNAGLGNAVARRATVMDTAFATLRAAIAGAYVLPRRPVDRAATQRILEARERHLSQSSFAILGTLRSNLIDVLLKRMFEESVDRSGTIANASLSVGVELLVVLGAIWLSLLSKRNERKRIEAEKHAVEAQRQALLADLTQAKAQQAMLLAKSQFQAVFDHAPTGMIIVNPDCSILDQNEAAEAMFAGSDECGRVLALVTENFESVSQILDGTSAKISAEYEFVDGSGTSRWFNVLLSPVHDDADAPIFVIVMIRDITESKSMEAQLLFDAEHDALTGLPNRRHFLATLQQTLDGRKTAARPDVFSVVFIDFNDFKTINDSFGHLAGDEFLVVQAARLRETIRATDVIARMGGDEFALIVHGTDQADIEASVRRMQAAVALPMTVGGQSVSTSASFGIAQAELDYDVAADLIRDADTAMYAAKSQGGRNHVVFELGMRDSVLRRMQMSIDIVKAVENNELELVYQPILDIQLGTIAGCEALVRWTHADGTHVSPAEFIPLAEENGAIIEIGQWVIETACRQMQSWNGLFAQGRLAGLDPRFTMHVNLAVPQMNHPGLIDHLQRTLQATGVRPGQIVLEITEGVILKNTETLRTTLATLTQNDIRLCIDDFGTGYSSLRYLNELPLFCFKIDKSFVSNGHDDIANASIIEMLMLLGRSLDLEVIAEGIETEKQYERLRGLGCRYGQGYLFSRPIHAAALTRKLEVAGLPILAAGSV